MQRALKMLGKVEIQQDFHRKRNAKRRSLYLWITMSWRWFMVNKFHHIQFSLQICIMFQTCVFKIILIGLCVCPLKNLKYYQGSFHRWFCEDNFGKPIIIHPTICSICKKYINTLSERKWIIIEIYKWKF